MEVIQAGSIFIVSVVSLSLCALQKQCALRNPVWSGLRTNLSTVTGEPTQKLGAPPKSICTICPFVYFFFFFLFYCITDKSFGNKSTIYRNNCTVLYEMKKSHIKRCTRNTWLSPFCSISAKWIVLWAFPIRESRSDSLSELIFSLRKMNR